MEIIIEPVKMEELDTLVQISRNTFFDTFAEQNTKEDMELFLEKTFRPEIIQAEMQHPLHHFFFAKIQNVVAGYLKLTTSETGQAGEKNVLEVSRIYVVKEHLGSGIGRALMHFALSFAERENIQSVYLGVWEHNQRAIRFYQQFGFEKCGEQVFMVGHDPQNDWIMKKDLQSGVEGIDR